MRAVLLTLVPLVTVVAAGQVLSFAQTPAGQAVPGVRSAPTYTTVQAALGQAAYRASCASCHGENLDDGAFGPPLKGVTFIQKYGGRSVAPLYTVSATRMPTTAPGSLTPAVYAQIVAYILQQNAIVAGNEELPSDLSRLEGMTIPQGGFSFMAFSPYTPPAPKVTRRNPLERYTPVTDEMLAAPPASEWLGWRRTWDAHGFSPLNQ